ELADAERELNIIDYELFRESLQAGIENTLNRFIPSLQEISYVYVLKEDLSNRNLTTFGLLEALKQSDFFEEFEVFANSDRAELAKFPLIHEFVKFCIWS
ncbi:9346_t:CDS:2, partial [Racocetra persica]